MKFCRLLVTLFVMLMIAACSNSPPETLARKKIENRVAEESKGQLRVIEFRKTDGHEFKFLGEKGYRINYEITIEAQQNLFWTDEFISGSGVRTTFYTINHAPEGMDKLIIGDFGKGKKLEKGERVTYSGSLTFSKTENGWQ